MVLVIGGISEAKVLCERLSEKYETTLSVATEYGAEFAKNGRYRVVCGKKSAEDFQRLLRSDRFSGSNSKSKGALRGQNGVFGNRIQSFGRLCGSDFC